MINKSELTDDINFVNHEPLTEKGVFELYAAKTKRTFEKKEEVLIDEGVLEANYTPYQLMFALLMRLNMRFTHEEVEYLEKQSNVPVLLFEKDGGKNQRWLTISQCQQMIKNWRRLRSKEHPIVSDEELLELEQLSQAPLEPEDSRMKNYENNYTSYVYFTMKDLHILPCLSGCLLDARGEKVVQQITVDTAASSSILPYKTYCELGFQESELDKSQQVTVATACSEANQALGFFETKVLLKSNNNLFYSLPVKFLVMKTVMKRVLLGIYDLRRNRADWKSSVTPEILTLSVKSLTNKEVRKSFNCYRPMTHGNLTLVNLTQQIGPIPSTVEYRSSLQLLSCDPSDLISEKGVEILSIKEKSPELVYLNEKVQRWPKNIEFCYEIELVSQKSRKASKALKTNRHKYEKDNDEDTVREAFENNRMSESEEGNLENMDQMPLVPDLDRFALDIAGVGPPDPDVKDKDKWFLPELSMSPFWNKKYHTLCEHFKDTFSQGKYDFVRSSLPPVSIELKPNSKPANDPVRRYGCAEMLLIDEYISNLIKAGHVRELTETTSPFNHCLVLVYRQVPGDKKFVSSKADRAALSQEERLEMLRNSSRLCADLRSLNNICKAPGGMHLSKFSEILPSFAHRVLSSMDIKSGYNIIELTPESQLYTAFVHRNKQFIWLTLPQGLVSAPALFVRRLSLAINDQAYNEFSKMINNQLKHKEDNPLLIYDADDDGNDEHPEAMKYREEKNITETEEIYRHTEVLQLVKNKFSYSMVLYEGFNSQVQAYLDDVLALAKNNLDHYYVVYFLLYQFSKFGVKLAASKLQLCGDKVTYLGYDVDTVKGRYGLTMSRKRDFSSWRFPTSRTVLQSRLCTANYFSNVILAFKVITQCLYYLVNSKDKVYHIKHFHRVEFEMLKLVMDLYSSFAIPDLRYPAIYSSDASFSSLSGTMLQFLPDETDPSGFTLQLVAQFSKKFSGTDPSKCPLYKEILGVLATLREYAHYIHNSSSFSVLFCDASSISMVTKMKHVNSRLHTLSMYVSSFPSLYIYFTPSSKMNFLADYVTKIYGGNTVNTIEAIPAKYLENIENIQLRDTLLTPELVHEVMQSPLPKFYCDISERRKQAYCPLMSKEDFETLMKQDVIEKQYLHGILYGLEKVPLDSLAFQRQDKKGIISKDEFEKMYNKTSGDQIREHFRGLVEHEAHILSFEETREDCKQWVKRLDWFIRKNKITNEPSLEKECFYYLQDKEPSLRKFQQLVDKYQKSSLYNTTSNCDEYFPTIFMLTFIHPQSQVNFIYEKGRAILQSRKEFVVKPSSVFILHVRLIFFTKYLLSVMPGEKTNWIFHPHIVDEAGQTSLDRIFIINKSDKELKVNKNQKLFSLIFHRQVKEKCLCLDRHRLKFILEYCKFDRQYEEENEIKVFLASSITGGHHLAFRKISEPKVMTNQMTTGGKYKGFQNRNCGLNSFVPPSTQHLGLENECDLEILANQNETEENNLENQYISPVAHNSLILGCLILNKKEVFTPSLIKKFQSTCPFLKLTKENLIKEPDKKSKFTLVKGVLFYLGKQEEHLLCLDKVTMAYIIQSVHTSRRHFSNDVMEWFLSSYFFCKDMKAMIAQERERCATCQFNMRCSKKKYVNNNSEAGPLKVFSQIHTDVDEFWPQSSSIHKFLILFIDAASGYCISYPMKRQTGDELCKIFLDLIKNFGVCEKLKSDFAPMYRSDQFRNLLQEFNISQEKYCPGRSAEAGRAEVNIKNFRKTFMDLLISEVGSDTKNWTSYLPYVNLIYNSMSLYSNRGVLSRFNLMFNSQRYAAPWLYNKPSDNNLELSYKQQMSFNKLFAVRQRYKTGYNVYENPYSINQYVVSPLGKGEFPTLNDSKGGQPTVQNLFQVLEKFPNSCRVISLLDSSESTIDIKDLRPLEPKEIRGVFGRFLLDEGTFSKSLFKRGNKDGQILQDLKNLPSYSPSGADINKNFENSEEIDDLEELTEEETGDKEEEVTEPSPGISEALPSHPYNLRSRKVMVNNSEIKIYPRFFDLRCRKGDSSKIFITMDEYKFIEVIGETNENIASILRTSQPKRKKGNSVKINKESLCQEFNSNNSPNSSFLDQTVQQTFFTEKNHSLFLNFTIFRIPKDPTVSLKEINLRLTEMNKNSKHE